MYAVDNRTWQGWYSYENLKHMITLMDEEGDYQWDSPEAEFVTGYNTDSYADDSCELIRSIWEEYLDECEEEEKTPDMKEYVDLVWNNFDYQLCHTWLRVTNIHIESDKEVEDWEKDNIKDMILNFIEEEEVRRI